MEENEKELKSLLMKVKEESANAGLKFSIQKTKTMASGPISSVLLLSCSTLCNPMDWTCQTSLSITNSWGLLKLMSIELVMPSNHLVFCHPLLLLPFSRESALHINGQSIGASTLAISTSSEYSGLVSFRIDWFDLLEVQVSLKSLLQQHSSKHQVFSPQVSLRSSSHIHTWTTGKRIALIIGTFVKNTAIVHSVKWEAHF